MQIGSHFGKRKPRWDFFSTHATPYLEMIQFKIIKYALLSTSVQMIVFFPIVYWTMENYDLFLQLIPVSTKLTENLQDEKKWILFLYFSSGIAMTVVNIFFYSRILQKSETNLDMNASSVEALDQRRAS